MPPFLALSLLLPPVSCAYSRWHPLEWYDSQSRDATYLKMKMSLLRLKETQMLPAAGLCWLVLIAVDVVSFTTVPFSHRSSSSPIIGHRRQYHPPGGLNYVRNSISSTSTQLYAKKAVAKVAGKTVLLGKMSAAISKFAVSPKRYLEIFGLLGRQMAADWADISLIVLACLTSKPLMLQIFQWRSKGSDDVQGQYRISRSRQVAQFLHELGILFAIMYFVDLACIFLSELKFEFIQNSPVDLWSSTVLVTIWGARNISQFKKYAIRNAIQKNPVKRKAPAELADRFLDILIYGTTILSLLDFLSVQTGLALKSLFGLSSVGTLVFSLGSQNLVSECLASLAIQGTNMYCEGEKILLADGTRGNVVSIGWLHTHIRRSDELVVRIPNTKIAGKRVANISRSRSSSIRQTLAVRYEDMERLPKLCQDIKEEIEEEIGDLLIKDERPFRVNWLDFKQTYLEVSVLAFLKVRPNGNDYYEAQEKALGAINRAMEKNGCEFSYTDFINPDRGGFNKAYELLSDEASLLAQPGDP